jgi:hypothetical protein
VSDPRNNKTGVGWRVSPNPSSFSSSPPLSPPERASERGGRALTDRRSGAIARLLTGGRRSPEGERAVIEQSRCDTLSREPELINPRVGVGKPRIPFPDSDEVGSDDGRPRYVSGSKT